MNNKSDDNKKTIKTALLNTIANIIAMVFGIIMIPVIARVIPTDDVGIASTFLSNRNILMIFFMLASYSYVHRAMLDFQNEQLDYIYTITLFCISADFLAFFVCLPFKDSIKKLLSLDEFLYYWLFISILIVALFYIADYYCIFHNKSMIIFLIVLTTGPVAQILSILFAFVLDNKKYIGRVIGLDAVYGIVAIMLLVYLFISGRHKLKKIYITTTLKFTIPIIPHILSQMVLTQSDLVMITYFEGSRKSGVYSMGHTVGFLAFTVMSQIMATWSPWVYRRLEEDDRNSIRTNSEYIMILGMYISIGLMTVASELIRLFLTEDYEGCVYIVPPLVVSMFIQFMYIFVYDLEYYFKKAKNIAIASAIAAIVNIFLNLILIPRSGYLAAGYTTMFSYGILLLINIYNSKKLGLYDTYSKKNFIVMSMIIIVYMFFVFFTLEHVLIRYIVLIMLSVYLFIKYKNIIMPFIIEKINLKRL